MIHLTRKRQTPQRKRHYNSCTPQEATMRRNSTTYTTEGGRGAKFCVSTKKRPHQSKISLQ